MKIFESVYNDAVIFANNLKLIHWYAKGDKFQEIHDIFEGYYNKAQELVDLLAELALEFGEYIYNSTYCGKIGKLAILNDREYDFRNAFQLGREQIEYIVEKLQVMQGKIADADVNSIIDEHIRYWKKEANYKIAAKLR